MLVESSTIIPLFLKNRIMLLMSLLRNSLEFGCLRSTADPKSKTTKPSSVLKILYSEKSPWTSFALWYRSLIRDIAWS